VALTFTSWSFDKASYNPGDAITLTVSFTSDDVETPAAVASAVTAILTDSSGSATQSSDASGNFPEFSVQPAGTSPETTTASATDNRAVPGTWAAGDVTFSGDAAPFAGTAVLTSTA
jgi:hypothetical protein